MVVSIGFKSCLDPERSNMPPVVKQYDEYAVKANATLYLKGKALFEKFCNSCHFSPDSQAEDNYFFDGIFEKFPSAGEQYFIQFVADSKQLKDSGDAYALEVDDIYRSSYEHLFLDSLTINNYTELIAYVKMATLKKNNFSR